MLASAHPRTIHHFQGFARPLFEVQPPAPGAPAEAYCVGSTDEGDAVSYRYQGFNFGSISMRMILFGDTVKPAIRC